ncbi:hypothetical protein ATO7_01090 [Oceanococcus atlanticus]|uniref:Uncharacterized protein n=1 Tax=Oceanococcus atlanticus TaxID=1317117 RepID=A0A1Y1SFI9_9GAMM|nr:hypothetical protein [Oceanococcus atlanticus]ORE88427.1 hypothetical protein ATO7_01090 [Oceanococcus atlanticus]RZO85499.1 MAG: hypothetical protein EVA65_06465 [Oceanococcus sp.]
MTQIRHFLLSADGVIEQISSENAALVAAGQGRLPNFAAQRAHYLQVIVDDPNDEDNSIQVRTAGALVGFDAEGRIKSDDIDVSDDIGSFEHDTCVQLALDGVVASDIIHH